MNKIQTVLLLVEVDYQLRRFQVDFSCEIIHILLEFCKNSSEMHKILHKAPSDKNPYYGTNWNRPSHLVNKPKKFPTKIFFYFHEFDLVLPPSAHKMFHIAPRYKLIIQFRKSCPEFFH